MRLYRKGKAKISIDILALSAWDKKANRTQPRFKTVYASVIARVTQS
jgi:hypothetical protein